MPTPADLARRWMQKGNSDRLTAKRTAETIAPYDTACFHAQQAAEKSLKAVLALAGSLIPRTHDLEDLYDESLAVAPGLALDRMELSVLTPYAVQLCYDMGFWPDQATAQQALATVDRVRAAVLAALLQSAHS